MPVDAVPRGLQAIKEHVTGWIASFPDLHFSIEQMLSEGDRVVMQLLMEGTHQDASLESALRSRRFGVYTLQAAIAAVHAESSSVASTDWRQIMLLYDRLLRIQPSPVVELNRAVAIAMCEGPEQDLRLIDDLLAREYLSHYHLAHSARADLCRRLGRVPEGRASYEKALALLCAWQRAKIGRQPDRRFLARRIEELK